MKKRIFMTGLVLASVIIIIALTVQFYRESQVVSMEAYEGNNQEDYANYDVTVEHDPIALKIMSYEKDELFQTSDEDIVYGQVKKIKPVVILSDKDSPSHKKLKYNAYLMQIKVLSDIYGDTLKGKTIWTLAGRAYTGSIKEKDEGIFIIFKESMRITIKDGDLSISVLGKIPVKYSKGGYAMTSKYPEVKKLKSKNEVIDYWIEHDLVWRKTY